MRLSPVYPHWFLHNLAFACLFAGRYEEAVDAFASLKEHNPEYGDPHIGLAIAHDALGRDKEARAELAAGMAISPELTIGHMRQHTLDKDVARLEEVLAILERLGMPK